MAKEKITKKSPKKLSPYNMFMKTELSKVKEVTPGISHKDAFKKAAQNWATASENPKNKKKEEVVEEEKK
ncbi:hypothetical protein MFLAVUS_007363 [Mucor flavus]|uniref:YABBY protein C-terminal domain-containing protein n=1 Tax=Mucor flavus TaxID=439312 RepID=A0ABP9Z447_9FUNG